MPVRFFFLLVCYFGLSGCDFTDNKLNIQNKTNDSLAFIILNESNYFPTSDTDTITNATLLSNPKLLNVFVKYDPRSETRGGVYFIAANSTKNLSTFNTTWDGVVKSNPGNVLEIIFIPSKYMTSGKFKWKDLYQQQLFDKRIIKYDELKKSNWIVSYSK